MSVLVGAIVPVLAWRLAADVAEERGMSPVGARTLALGTGLTSAVYLPLVLHSALPDSTMLFAALALGACLLMARVLADPRQGRLADARLLGIGVLLGLAALTRNEAAWLALTWVGLVAVARDVDRATKVRIIGVVGIVAALVFAPWALRNWSAFGSPLPGQAVTNAFSVTGFDIFAWNDPPTLARYLAVGPARLIEMRVEGLAHNLFNVLVLPGFPLSAIGLLALPWTARGRAVRPVLVVSLITFLVTSLVFPVATTWGTFLHAAGPAQVLIVLSALLALDGLLAAVGRRLGWTKDVSWLGATMGVASSVLFSVVLLAGFATGSHETARLYDELATRMSAVDRSARHTGHPPHEQLPDLGRRDPARLDARVAGRATRGCPRPGGHVPRDQVPHPDQPGIHPLAGGPRGRPGRRGMLRADRPRAVCRHRPGSAAVDDRLRDRLPWSGPVSDTHDSATDGCRPGRA